MTFPRTARHRESYAQFLMGMGPAGLWLLDESTGTNAEDKTGGDDGTYTGTYTLGTKTPIAPRTASIARCFAASQNGYIQCTDGGLSIGANDDFFVSCWFRGVNTAISDTLFGRRDSAGVNKGFALKVLTELSDQPAFLLDSGSGFFVLGTGFDGHDGEWHNIIGGRDGTTMRIYTDGVAGTTSTNAGIALDITPTDAPLRIGGTTFTSQNIDGEICFAATFQRAPNQADAIAIYSHGIRGMR